MNRVKAAPGSERPLGHSKQGDIIGFRDADSESSARLSRTRHTAAKRRLRLRQEI